MLCTPPPETFKILAKYFHASSGSFGAKSVDWLIVIALTNSSSPTKRSSNVIIIVILIWRQGLQHFQLYFLVFLLH